MLDVHASGGSVVAGMSSAKSPLAARASGAEQEHRHPIHVAPTSCLISSLRRRLHHCTKSLL
jgi:hypothetical protein